MAMDLYIFRKKKLQASAQDPVMLNYSASSDEFSLQLEAWRGNMLEMVVGEKIDFEKMTYFTPEVVEGLMKSKPKSSRKQVVQAGSKAKRIAKPSSR